MYALLDIKGKQYKAEKGSKLKVDLLEKAVGEKIQFDSIVMISDNDNITIGAPYVAGAKITATVEKHDRDKKVIIGKFKKRKNYRRKNGHRQDYSVIMIDDIAI